MKIVTVVGARPQFIKAAAVSRVIRDDYRGAIEEVLVHTGQHYDENMSGVFFDELDIQRPRYNLEISGGHHGAMTGRMLSAVEEVLLTEKPDWLLVYGDTNSTLAGALAAVKQHIPVAHVEAGLRSFRMSMPEEVNRVVSDRVSTLLFCPTSTAVRNLAAEGITKGVHNVGDVMFDVSVYLADLAGDSAGVLKRFGVQAGDYYLATCHRAENTDDRLRLKSVLEAFGELAASHPVVFPLHPRTRTRVDAYGYEKLLEPLTLTGPLSFLQMTALERSARTILTDSGGVQKEAFFYRIPCVTMRDETEWLETVDSGWNQLTGVDRTRIVTAATNPAGVREGAFPYGTGDASRRIIATMLDPGAVI